ncbi:hypothetical protein FJTKL_12339 [Diaporthe vaccinii]|uniref:Uncharacterized protein n=1 Tax=Diaporthe vaccinii TaxID=105482 RepID=A0ABR4EEJ0_9PEZI
MQKDAATLDVRDGFWKGVNSSNLHHVFTPVEERKSDIHLLADYTQLFGEGFQQAQRDIRPYLPHWAQCTVPCQTPPYEVTPGSGRKPQQIDAPAFSESDVQALRQCLNPPHITAERLRALEPWLWQQLATVHGPAEPLSAWCEHWEHRMDKAEDGPQQLITQSLFLHSLDRLERLHITSIASVTAVAAAQHEGNPEFTAPLHKLYMVVDMSDSKTRPLRDESLAQETLDILRAVPAYRAVDAANADLAHIVEAQPHRQAALDRMGVVTRVQLDALRYITTLSPFADYFFGVLAFEALRARTLTHALEASPPVPEHSPSDDALYGEEMAAKLQLTRWQLLQLQLPGAVVDRVLTPPQSRVARTQAGTETTVGADALPAMPVRPSDLPSHECGSALQQLRETHKTMCRLFGTVQQPDSVPPTAETEAAQPPQEAVAKRSTQTKPAPADADSESDSIAQSHSPKLREPSQAPIVRNAFGEWHAPTKRPASPGTTGRAKAPRLGLHGSLDELRDVVQQEATACRDEVRACREQWQAGWQAERERGIVESEANREEKRQFEESIQTSLDSAVARFQSALDGLHSDIEALGSGLGSVQAQLQDLSTWKTEILSHQQQAGTKAEGAQEQLQKAIRSNTEQLTSLDGHVVAEISEVKAMLSQPPAAPETGCLALDCPAPDGYDQKAYKACLFQACMVYVCMLWDPLNDGGRGGVGRDCIALEEIKKQFLGLEEKALVEALEYFHKQLFNCPLGGWSRRKTGM